jgi:hypothetical protein
LLFYDITKKNGLFGQIEKWDNMPLFVKYNPGLLDLLVLLDETGLQTGL